MSIPFAAARQGSRGFAMALARSWASPLPVDLWKWRVDALRARAAEILASGGIDLCVADFLVADANVPASHDVPVVLFEHNVEYAIWQRLARLERRPLHRALLEIEWRKMRRAEAATCSRADLTIAVSEDDRRHLQRLAPTARCVAVPTGVDVDYFRPLRGAERPRHLVFTGSMDWYPNEDAIFYFAAEILPLIRAAVDDVTLSVVGRNPTAALRARAGEAGITVTGSVDDVRPYMDEAALFVVPLRAGGGTRLKIFEALAMSKAVVSTSVGAEGLGVGPGAGVLIADTPAAFAEAVVGLLRQPHRRAELGAAGRRLVEAQHSWEQASRVFEQYCQALAGCGYQSCESMAV